MSQVSRTNIVILLSAAALTACGGGGGSSTPPADTSAPQTTLTGNPGALTRSTSASFAFTASEGGATFEARTDGAAFAAVTAPHTLSALADGSHTFEVRARDVAGNVDATPASFTWVVDSTPPDTQITSSPSSATAVNAATFTVNSSEAGSILEASVDGAPFAVVTSPYTVTVTSEGNHTVQFRARDAADNVDATPATASWALDTSAPEVRLHFPTRLFYTDASTVSVRGTAQDARGVTALSINGVAAQTSDAFAHWRAVIPVPFGTTPVRITSSDGLGNARALDAATMVNRGIFVNDASGIGYDGLRDRVVVVDQGTGAVVVLNRSDGITRMLSPGPGPVPAPGAGLGSGWGAGLQSVVIDSANDRALIMDSTNDALISVDLASGARSVVSAGIGGNSPTRINRSFHLALDAPGQRAYVMANETGSVVRIDLATGLRTVVSSSTVGTGALPGVGFGIAYDAVTNPAAPRLLTFTSPSAPPGILAIDLATGNRTPFSTETTGSGTPLFHPREMVMDPAGQRLIVVDVSASLVAVALANGDRTLINSPGGPGSGPNVFIGYHVGFDPVARRLFGMHWFSDFAEVDVVTQERKLIAGSSIGRWSVNSIQLGTVIEPSNGPMASLVSVEGYSGIVSRFDLMTAERLSVSSSDFQGSGPSIKNATDMALDRRPTTTGRKALVLVTQPNSVEPTPKIVSVDLTTSNRTLVADVALGSYNSPQKMALDVTHNRAVITNNEFWPPFVDGLYAVDLATGITTTISDGSHSGPVLSDASYVVLEPATNPTRALVADESQPRILAIDLATGARTVFDTLNAGHAGPMLVDSAHARLLVANADAPSSLVAVPLSVGGSRLLISGADPVSGQVRGSGPPQLAVSSFDVDMESDVAYVSSSGNRALLAIDMESGDRIVIER